MAKSMWDALQMYGVQVFPAMSNVNVGKTLLYGFAPVHKASFIKILSSLVWRKSSTERPDFNPGKHFWNEL